MATVEQKAHAEAGEGVASVRPKAMDFVLFHTNGRFLKCGHFLIKSGPFFNRIFLLNY